MRHVVLSTGGAHLGNVALAALGDGGADCDVLVTAALDGLTDGTYLLRVHEYGDVAVDSAGVLDDDALGGARSDALGRGTVTSSSLRRPIPMRHTISAGTRSDALGRVTVTSESWTTQDPYVARHL